MTSKLLILDEPTVGVDLLAREEVLSLIEQVVSRPCHVLYVTHYIEEIVGSITHVLLLQDGRIVAAGRKEDVLTDERLSATFRLYARSLGERAAVGVCAPLSRPIPPPLGGW